MTLSATFEPLVVCVVIASMLPLVHRRLTPRTSAGVLAATTIWISVAAVVSLWMFTLRYLSHVSWLKDQLVWCSSIIGDHGSVPTLFGLPAVMLSLVGIRRFARLVRTQRHIRSNMVTGTTVVDTAEVFAFSIPGSRRAVVVSTGLLDNLSSDEQAVVFAHENSHVSNRHDRYLVIARASEAFLPMLAPLTRRMEFSLERWADDDACAAVCGNRRLVATTIAKVALLPQRTPKYAMAFTGIGTAARTRSLLRPTPASQALTAMSIVLSMTGLGVAVYQLHHLEALITTLCRT